ncbi:MAG: YkgJ family cysteine cluster protein [Planctomycetota bacterium]|nr:YkgJ family cysteine cluster protein [Planctomycetota bacterium]
MVAAGKANTRLLRKVAEIYNWLDSQICENSTIAGHCDACGKCCDFNKFDHRLFVTTPELLYLAAKVGDENVKTMTSNLCPYQTNSKCTIYKFRFAGCRIFCCKGDADFQSRLSEMALKKFKSICEQFQIPYRYIDLPSALVSAQTK